MKRVCEIIYVTDAKAWKWRVLPAPGADTPPPSKEAFELFYECVSAARARGYVPNVKCP